MSERDFLIRNFYKNKRVLVDGGTGFIGSFIVKSLVGLKAQVFVVFNSKKNTWRLEDIKNKIETIKLDLRNERLTNKILSQKNPEVVINAAAILNNDQSLNMFDKIIENNFKTALNLIRAAEKNKTDKFVQIGTIAEYGNAKPPFKESMREKPISPYSLSKIMATYTALFYNRVSKLKTTVVRPAATFGPAQNFGVMLIPNLIRSCLKNKDFDMNPGNQIRDFIYVEDLVRGILMAGASPNANGEIFNLGSNRGYKIKNIMILINKLMSNPIKINFGAFPYRPLDTMAYYMDSSKAKKILGWNAETKIEVALQKTVDWYILNIKKLKFL
jgi:nucleoside-diphosphate-sugar epimerase